MDRFIFRLPDLGEGVVEAEIAAWHVRRGDTLAEDQPLLDLMTDKASVEVTTPVAGVVAAIFGEVGDRLPVGSTLVEIDQRGAATDGAAPAAAADRPLPADLLPATPPPPASPLPSPREAGTTSADGGGPIAAPATRNRARELGIALAEVAGTGPGGRILGADLDAFAARRETKANAGKREIRITGVRRRIAERMEEASRRIPHIGYVEQFDLTELEALRRELNETRAPDRPKLTLLPFFMRALVRAVPEFPEINARFDDDAGVLRCSDAVHVGIATQTGAGLLVPVVRHAENRDLWDCACELARVTEAARNGTAASAELAGSTITLTSLGPLGGIAATPIINRPEVAIIAPNKLEKRPLVVDGQVMVRLAMNVSSSFDHRIVDGHGAARFIQQLKRVLERPALLFVDGRTTTAPAA